MVHPLVQAGVAIGIAGAGRVALNSFISVKFGTDIFGQYATGVASVILVGSLASAGPAAATTLSVARRWSEAAGILPSGLVRFVGLIFTVFLVLGVGAGWVWSSTRGVATLSTWTWAAALYITYQVGRALGYAVQDPLGVTRAEVLGAIAPLVLILGVLWGGGHWTAGQLVGAFAVGPTAFLIAFTPALRRRVRVVPGALRDEERSAAVRESVVFFVGAGSSMAMQFLPVVIAGRLHATTTAALLFGAVQATAPLLLLSRIYGTIMMPAFAAVDAEDESHKHLSLVRPFLVPSLALALGLAPWVPFSLGVAPDAAGISLGALVALMTLLQVWATPAVTVLSARHREMVPALSSLGGLLVAVAVWAWAVWSGSIYLLPLGLALGAVVRSLVPMWIITGRHVGNFGGGTWKFLLQSVGVVAVIAVLGRLGAQGALAGGTLLCGLGSVLALRVWRKSGVAVT